MHEDVSESNRQRVRSCARSGYRRVPHGPSFTGIQSVFYTPRSNVCVQYYEDTRQMRHAVPMLRKRILCVIANHGLIDIITHPSKIFIYTVVHRICPGIGHPFWPRYRHFRFSIVSPNVDGSCGESQFRFRRNVPACLHGICTHTLCNYTTSVKDERSVYGSAHRIGYGRVVTG